MTNDLVIYEPWERVDTVYFPGAGVVSIIQVMHDGTAAEIGLVGREGICGLDAILRDGIAAGRHLCQVPGTAWTLPAVLFQEELKDSEDLLRSSLAYVGAYSAMLAQLIACNRLHRVEQRCARWLLMTIDRISALEFPMTQERLSMMLGAQRPTVTAVMASLRDAGCLQNSRGRVRVTDRSRLESFACECYAICAAYFDL